MLTIFNAVVKFIGGLKMDLAQMFVNSVEQFVAKGKDGCKYPGRFVYLVKCQDFVKIGVSYDAKKRFEEIQSANPFTLELIAFIRGNHSMERQIHQMFDKFRVHGEWFQYTNEVKNKCKEIFNLV